MDRREYQATYYLLHKEENRASARAAAKEYYRKVGAARSTLRVAAAAAQKFQDVIDRVGGKLVEAPANKNHRVAVTCSEGHLFSVRARDLDKGVWCDECAESICS